MPGRYPVLVDLADRPCLVVGGGSVAARKVAGLLEAGADVTVVSPRIGPRLQAFVDAGRVAWREGGYGSEATDRRWRFVVAATDDPAVNRTVVADAEAAGVWANDAGDRRGGPAALPAVHRSGPVTVAVATGGTSPGAAAWLRDLLAAAVGPEHIRAIELVAACQDAAPGGAKVDWRRAVDSGMLSLIRAGREAEAKERLQACLSSSSD